MRRKETVFYLEMARASDLRPAARPALPLEIKRAEVPCPEVSRFFYRAVGGDWYWVDRLVWTEQQWTSYVRQPHQETWIAYLSGTPAGYFELQGEPGQRIEIVFLGLLPRFRGQGIGGFLLTFAVKRAWEKGATVVWLHTSSFDHPQAMNNYLARGFRLARQASAWIELPEQPPRFWATFP